MPTKTASTEVPEGYEVVGKGNFAPFFDLPEAGMSLEAIVLEVRRVTRKEKVRIKGKTEEVDKTKYYFDLELLKAATGDDASRAHNSVTHQAGTKVTLSGAGNLVRKFMDAAMKKEKKTAEDWPEDGAEPEINWEVLYGLNVYIRREADGKMGKNSAFPGNKVRQYTVAFEGLS